MSLLIKKGFDSKCKDFKSIAECQEIAKDINDKYLDNGAYKIKHGELIKKDNKAIKFKYGENKPPYSTSETNTLEHLESIKAKLMLDIEKVNKDIEKYKESHKSDENNEKGALEL